MNSSRRAGRGAWLPWPETRLHGGGRAAQRYMPLARRIGSPASLHGLSLRQAPLRLGIAIPPQSNGTAAPVRKLPAPIALSEKMDAPSPPRLRAGFHTSSKP